MEDEPILNICVAICYPTDTPGMFFRVTRQPVGFKAVGCVIADGCQLEDKPGYGHTITEAVKESYRKVQEANDLVDLLAGLNG